MQMKKTLGGLPIFGLLTKEEVTIKWRFFVAVTRLA